MTSTTHPAQMTRDSPVSLRPLKAMTPSGLVIVNSDSCTAAVHEGSTNYNNVPASATSPVSTPSSTRSEFINSSYSADSSASSPVSKGSIASEESGSGLSRASRNHPSACIFVASLAASYSLEDLKIAVSDAFKKWDPLDVTVHRDSMDRPYAFVQLANLEQARDAVTAHRGTILLQRPMRCELARVNRSVCLSSSSRSISMAEAEELFQEFGPLEYLICAQIQYAGNLLTGWCTRFEYREDAIAAYFSLKNDPDCDLTVSYIQNPDLSNPIHHDRTIYIRNLNVEVTEKDLREHFSVYGPISSVHIDWNKTSKYYHAVTAEVKFCSFDAVPKALHESNETIFLNQRMYICNGRLTVKPTNVRLAPAPKLEKEQDVLIARHRESLGASSSSALLSAKAASRAEEYDSPLQNKHQEQHRSTGGFKVPKRPRGHSVWMPAIPEFVVMPPGIPYWMFNQMGYNYTPESYESMNNMVGAGYYGAPMQQPQIGFCQESMNPTRAATAVTMMLAQYGGLGAPQAAMGVPGVATAAGPGMAGLAGMPGGIPGPETGMAPLMAPPATYIDTHNWTVPMCSMYQAPGMQYVHPALMEDQTHT
ncbi:uncharacterized protein V1516DRAFT_666589 [Lipomyces oligophaga]|uniref:uncharacterized protein n=1 Tax=Lipomyces oligophaga TaxID=45792 RepID=UPI0034CEF484